jgi:membrane-bound lytic murein transglycosylase F
MRRFAAGLLLLTIAAAEPLSGVDTEPPVPRFAEAAELVVVTRNSPTTRYTDADGNYAGLEHDLVEMFARELGVPVRFVEADSYADVLPRLERHQAHMAAAGLSITPERARRFLFSPPYMEVQQVLVHNGTLPRPRSLRDLESRRIEVVADSSGAETLHRLAERLPRLQFDEVHTVNPEDLLIRVAEGSSDYAVAGSHIVDVARNFHPNLTRGLAFGDTEQLAWAFPMDGDPQLVRRARDFFARVSADGTLKRLMDRYYGHVKRLDRADLDGLFEAMRTRLPAYRALFREAQDLTGVDWRLLAALGFQESKWDPLATSPTGVRGMMMLTGTTADRLGVRDRLDPRESILAGARYFRDLRDALPPRIGEPDRTWMALAAYNQGLGHLEDARVLAQRQGLSPDAWVDVKKTLPLLSRPDVYETLRYGFARGGEALVLTENVRNFYDILVRFEEAHRPAAEPAGFDRMITTFDEGIGATLRRVIAAN